MTLRTKSPAADVTIEGRRVWGDPADARALEARRAAHRQEALEQAAARKANFDPTQVAPVALRGAEVTGLTIPVSQEVADHADQQIAVHHEAAETDQLAEA